MSSSPGESLRSRIAHGETQFDHIRLTDSEIGDIQFEGSLSDSPCMLMLRGSDFSGAALKRWSLFLANFQGSDFQATTFEDCTFQACQFQGCDFFGAVFRECTFLGCYMFEAFYSRASFINCVFVQTSMKDSVITGVTFTRTNIDGIKFDGFSEATRKANGVLSPALAAKATDIGAFRNIIDDASLDMTISMMSARRRALSSLEGHSFQDGESYADRNAKHFSSLTEIGAFLRSTTLTADEIQAFLRRYKTAAEARSFFISYSFRDSRIAEQLADRLGARGSVVWFAPDTMKSGAQISTQLDSGLYQADVLLVLVSQHSLTSDWVRREIQEFHRLQRHEPERKLCPIKLDGSWEPGSDFPGLEDEEASAWFKGHYALDFSTWQDPPAFSSAFERLAREFDVIADPAFAVQKGSRFEKSVFRTVGREAEIASTLGHSLDLPQDSIATSGTDQHRFGIGKALLLEWQRARSNLRRERSSENRDAEASNARRLASFLDINRSEVAGIYVATAIAKELRELKGLELQPELAKALASYAEAALGTPVKAAPKKVGWWPFRRG